jgi:tRNA pseudouridine38-40 synthase
LSFALPRPVLQTPRGPRYLPAEGEVNLRFDLSYSGHAFAGYQSQPHANTVQDTLRELWKIYRGEDPNLFGCSRLDAGVDANHFVLNFFTRAEGLADDDSMLRNLNGILHSRLGVPVSVERVSRAPGDFNARFDAHGKHYRYLLWYGFRQHAILTPRSWLVRCRNAPEDLDKVFSHFVGTHDFSAFRASDCTAKNTVRTIRSVKTWHHPRFNELTVVDFFGEGFLKNMIRNIVGAAVDCATGKMPPEALAQAFAHGTRGLNRGQCAPAHGLTLERVYYDEQEYKTHADGGVPFLLH